MLRVNRVPPGDPSTAESVGQNRFECPTCPYQLVLSKRFYERKYLKKKEVEDILGGKGAWDNVDQTEGKLYPWVFIPFDFEKGWGGRMGREKERGRGKEKGKEKEEGGGS
jgi:hypothetical protein